MKTRALLALAFAPTLIGLTGVAHADLELPRPSPMARVMQTVGLTEIEVEYSSPAVRGRKVWGELVPFGQHWRTGANQNTLIRFSGPVTIGGKNVEAGEYSVHTVPGKVSWTVVLNKKTDGTGSGTYDKAQDVLRTSVSVLPGPPRERMVFVFSDTTASRTHLDLEWAGLRVRLPIAVDTEPTVLANIEREVDGLWRVPAQAARYLVDNGGDLKKATELVNASIAIKEHWYNYMIKGLVFGAQGQKDKAVEMTKKALSMGDESGAFRFYEGRMNEQLSTWAEG